MVSSPVKSLLRKMPRKLIPLNYPKTSPFQKARVITEPILEVHADDIKCSHGATVGNLNQNELFYLKARGIPENKARQMLRKAFVHDIIEKQDNPLVKTLMTSKLLAKDTRERMMTPEDQTIRSGFPQLLRKIHGKPLIYFDNAASTLKHASVIESLSHYYTHDVSNITGVSTTSRSTELGPSRNS